MIKNSVLRILVLLLGFISLTLGMFGVILSILPTAPFLLLRSFCFVRSSTKFNNWFLNSKIYKKNLENFAKHKVMTLKGELILLICVSIMLTTTMFIINNKVLTIVFVTLICLKYLYCLVFVSPVTKQQYIKLREGEINA